MRKKLRKRTRRSGAGRRPGDSKGFELNVSPEEIISDLEFGVGSLWETAHIAHERRSEGEMAS